MLKNKNIDFHASSRSGHHAIIYWMLNNLGGCYPSKFYLSIDHLKGLNDCNLKTQVYFYNTIANKPNVKFPSEYNYLVRNFESVNYIKECGASLFDLRLLFEQEEETFFIIRDFLNLRCSRYKRRLNRNLSSGKPVDINLELSNTIELVDVWKQEAFLYKNLPHKTFSYNKWVLDKNYRDYIGDCLSIPNKIDNTNMVPDVGKGSSYIGLEKEKDLQNYFTRYKSTKMPENCIEYILSDSELQDLNLELFDIDIHKALTE
jgi:hypothetical protein